MNEINEHSSVDLQRDVHRRRNPLNGEWVLVSPHRTARPWQGQTEARDATPAASHDPTCYLCPGNARAGGAAFNPAYDTTFVFENDFAALRPDGGTGTLDTPLLRAERESGICRVICYSPLHNQSWTHLSLPAIHRILDTWSDEFAMLGANPAVNAVTIFENRGAMMGASSPHPHGQVWANANVPPELGRESLHQARHLQETGECLLCAYATLERTRGERVVCANRHFLAVVPFWATWPFEILVLPVSHRADITALDRAERESFAEILKSINTRYDALFDVTFPYTMGLHQRPTDAGLHPAWHFHAHFFPPLLRSATVRKFMVGYELLAGPQRDLSPESAAALLRGSEPVPCT